MTRRPAAATDAGAPEGSVRVRASLPDTGRRSPLGVVLSLALHVGVVLLALRVGAVAVETRGNPFAAFVERFGGGGGGGTGGDVAFIIPPAAPPAPAPEVPVPEVVPTVVPQVVPTPDPVIELPPVPVPVPTAPGTAGSAGTGGGSGGGAGTGQGPGTGAGTGPGSGGGAGGGLGGGGRAGSPPTSRTFIVPPIDAPRSLRGRTVDVTFHVDATGRVTDIDVVPPIADRGYARKFDEAMRGFRFRPARDGDGSPVAGVVTMSVTIGA